MESVKIQGGGYRDPRKLYWHDYPVKYLFLPFFPRAVRPNHLTVFRFLMTPVVLWLLYAQNYKWGAFVFLLAAFSDVLDGTMARARNQITDWGTVFDPIADKILIGSVLILLVFRALNIYIAATLVALEILHLVGGLILKRRGGVIRALFWGKAKMVSEVTGVILLLIFLATGRAIFGAAANLIFIIAIGFSAISLLVHGFRDF